MNIMDKPSLKQIKEKYKNVKEVRCVFDNKIEKYNSEKIHFWNEDVWCGSYLKIWDSKNNKYAEIISYKAPLYQLTAKEIVYGHDKPQYWKDTFPEAFEKELEVNRWYKWNGINPIIGFVDRKTNLPKCYGFKYTIKGLVSPNNYNSLHIDNLETATEKEVETALINEAKKRYKVGDEVISAYNKEIKQNINRFNFNYCYQYDNLVSDFKSIDNTSVCLYRKGKWAEIIQVPTYTIHEAEQKFNIKIINPNV